MVLCDGTGPLTTRTSAPGTSGGSRFTKFCVLFEPVTVGVLRMPPLPDCALQVKADVRSVAAIAALVSMALFGLEGIVRCEWGVSNGVQVPTVGVLGWERGDSGENFAHALSCDTVTFKLMELLQEYGTGCGLNSKSFVYGEKFFIAVEDALVFIRWPV
ncbi:unnamed protein product [Gadus morhua 'NCC']